MIINRKIIKLVSLITILLIAVIISILPAHYSYADTDKTSLEVQLAEQTKVLEEASNTYWAAEQQAQAARAQANEAQSKIDTANNNIQVNKDKLVARATDMYRNGAINIWDLLLGCASFNDLVNNIELVNKYNNYNEQLVISNKEQRQQLEEQQEVLQEKITEAEQQAQQALDTKNNAEQIQANLQNQLNQLAEAEKEATLAASRNNTVQEPVNVTEDSTPGSGSTPSADSSIAGRALSQCGKPYQWGACGPDAYDCSGLVSYAVSGAYVRLGTAATFCSWNRISAPEPGDICCNSGHCGIYIGGGSMVHAPQPGDVVRVSGVQSGMIYTRK